MYVDCDNCPVQGIRCDSCLVTLLRTPPVEVGRLNGAELTAVETLSRAGFEVTVLEPATRGPADVLTLQRRGRQRPNAA